nr:hypothetical protein [Candidatus Sodalis sp. SoCistrobi]
MKIIIYTIRKLSAKEIAPKLGIPHRTVENKRLRFYAKADVCFLKGLINYWVMTPISRTCVFR